jgi:hypothetical protein
MRNIFKLKGLSRNNGDIFATCELMDREETFQAAIDMDIDRKEALWDFMKNNWGDGAHCFIEYKETVSPHSSIPKDGLLKKMALDF